LADRRTCGTDTKHRCHCLAVTFFVRRIDNPITALRRLGFAVERTGVGTVPAAILPVLLARITDLTGRELAITTICRVSGTGKVTITVCPVLGTIITNFT
jgi:hypothetical protein